MGTFLVTIRDGDTTKAYQLNDVDVQRLQDLNKTAGNAFEITVHDRIGTSAEDAIDDFEGLYEAEQEEREADRFWTSVDAAYDSYRESL